MFIGDSWNGVVDLLEFRLCVRFLRSYVGGDGDGDSGSSEGT